MNSLLVSFFAVASFSSAIAFSTQPSYRSTALRSQPNFGDWTNDDFLNSLGGESPDDESQQETSPQQRQAAQNNLTDDEITEMAMRAAQFYNTDTSIEEAYGVRREGPPRKEE